MVAIRTMLLVLAAVPSTAVEQNCDVFVETGSHHCETKHLSLFQSKLQVSPRDTPVQPVLAAATSAQLATTTASHMGGLWGVSSTSSKCAAAMLVILSLTLGILIWTQRSRFQNSSTKELIATSCVVLYMMQTITLDVVIRKFHEQGVSNAFQFSPVVFTLFVEIGKLAVMIVGASVDWKNTSKCSLAEFGSTAKLMTIPAACFVALNILRFTALSGADLDQYRVWRSTDIFFVACIWFSMFKKAPSSKQIVGIGLVMFSCLIMGVGHNQDKKSSGEVSAAAIITVLTMAFLSSLGLVMNEFGLKANTELSIFVQGAALYFVTTVLNSAVVLASVPMGQIFQGIESPQIALIGLDVFGGVCIACVLKYADAITKQLASGWLAPMEPLVGHFLVGTPCTPVMVFATLFAGAGSIVYRLPEGKQEEKKEEVQSAIKQAATKQ